MSLNEEAERRHSDVNLAGFRAHASAIGLLQLLKELQIAGVLSKAAVERIRDAIVDELLLSRPIRSDAEEFRDRLQSRFARLLE